MKPGIVIGARGSENEPAMHMPMVAEDEELDSGFGDSNSSKSSMKLISSAVAYVKRILERRAAVSRLLAAIRAGNTMEVLEALTSNAGVLAEFKSAYDGNSVWHLLAEYGDASQLQALVNFIKIHAHTEEMQRIANNRTGHLVGSDELINVLINQGNNLNQTPLMFAAYHGRDESVKLLLQQGADPWAYDRCGQRTALHYACRKGHTQCVRVMLDNLQPQHQINPLGHKYVDVRTASGFTPLHFAVAIDSVHCVRLLISYGASIHFFNFYSSDDFWVNCPVSTTPLHLAALLGLHNVAMALLRTWWDELRHKGGTAALDPRRFLDKSHLTPFQVAVRAGYDELAEKLHPNADIESMWSPADLAKFAASGNVPSLQVIVASVLEARFTASIQEAVDCMKLLGTYQQAGRVFGRQGRYTFPLSGDSLFVRDSSCNVYDPNAMGPPTATAVVSPVPPPPTQPPSGIQKQPKKQQIESSEIQLTSLSVAKGPDFSRNSQRGRTNGKVVSGMARHQRVDSLTSDNELSIGIQSSQEITPTVSTQPSATATSSPFNNNASEYAVRRPGSSLIGDNPGSSLDGMSPTATQAKALSVGATRSSFGTNSITLQTVVSGQDGDLQNIDHLVAPGISEIMAIGRMGLGGTGANSQRSDQHSEASNNRLIGDFAATSTSLSASTTTNYSMRIIGYGEHAHAIMVYPLEKENTTRVQQGKIVVGVALMSVQAAMEREMARAQMNAVVQEQPQPQANRTSQQYNGSMTPTYGTGNLRPQLTTMSMESTRAAANATAGGPPPTATQLPVLQHAYTKSLATTSRGHYIKNGNSPSQSVSGGKSGKGSALDTFRSWIGYDRMYDAQRGAKLGQHGQEASSLRQYETALEKKRTRRWQEAAKPRAHLCGVVPLPHCLFEPSVDLEAEGLRPGVDVCGMCMDNKPLLEMRQCRHRICIMCAKLRVQMLELRQLVTCPYCTNVVHDFVLA